MVHLIKLELKKFKLNRYILISVCLIMFTLLFTTISLVDSATDSTQSKDTLEGTFQMLGILLSFIFIIFYSVLVSSFVIKEYNTKTILIMFCYPIDRKRLIGTKLLIISIFIILSLLLGYVFCCCYIIGIDFFFDLIDGNFNLSFLFNWIIEIILSSLVCICLGLLTFSIGMRKKSVPSAIISSLILIFIRLVALSSSYGYTENLIQSLVVASCTVISLWYTLSHNINKID